MQTAPLQLRHLTIDRLLLETEADGNAENAGVAETAVQVGPIASSTEQPALWHIGLAIRVGPGEGGRRGPYTIDVHLSGLFEVTDIDAPEAEIARLVAVNGASILYSAAREHVWLLTSRGKWGSFSLPTMSFFGLEVTKDPPMGIEEAAGDSPTGNVQQVE